MGCFKILDQNWAFDSTVDVLPTSENTEFPASNMQRYLRSQVWRSAGFFKITATNNKLDFSDGSTQLATITPGTYSTSELASEIKQQMDSVSVDNFTVSYSSTTGKWSIASSGATFTLKRATGANLAQSFFPVIGFGTDADSSGLVTYTSPNIALHTEEGMTFDLKVQSPVDYVAVIFSPLSSDGIKFSESAEIRLQGSETNEWTSPPFDQLLTIDPDYDVITSFFTQESHRYWRIKIVDPENAHLYVELSKVLLGVRTEIQNPEIGFAYTLKDLSKSQQTAYGHPYGDIYPSLRAFDFNFAAMTDADTTTLHNIYSRLGTVVPCAIDVDGNAEIFDKDKFFLYGRLSGDFAPSQRFLTYFDAKLTIEETL